MSFVLDERLRKDCFDLGRGDLCRTLLMNDSRFPWLILVPEREDVTEIHQLAASDRTQLMRESCKVGQALAREFGADKLNVAALGNVVSQLHVHHVVRYRSDCAWPRPIWCVGAPEPYDDDHLQRMLARLRTALPALRD